MVQVIALDGHDGSGKSTLSKALADRFNCKPIAPFSSQHGPELLQAGLSGDTDRTINIGTTAIENAIVSADGPLIVLDRSWITVASLVPWAEFKRRWKLWNPTVLCWCDLETTLHRLSKRQEPEEKIDWHMKYLSTYKSIATDMQIPKLRTDRLSIHECVEKLESMVNLPD